MKAAALIFAGMILGLACACVGFLAGKNSAALAPEPAESAKALSEKEKAIHDWMVDLQYKTLFGNPKK